MNNITNFIQPVEDIQPSAVDIAPQFNTIDNISHPIPMVATTASGETDSYIIIGISVLIAILLMYIIYKYIYTDKASFENFIANEKIAAAREKFAAREKLASREKLDEIDPLTRCGWEVRVSPTCPYCIQQKNILAEYFPTFKNIFTDKPAEVVPTWVNNITGVTMPGMQTHEQLLKMVSNC